MLDILKVLLVTLLVSFENVTSTSRESAQCNGIDLNLKLKVSELETQNARLQLEFHGLNENHNEENCTGLLNETSFILKELKTMQTHFTPLKEFIGEEYQINPKTSNDEDEKIQRNNKEKETLKLKAVEAEVNQMSKSLQNFFQEFQTFNNEIHDKLINTQVKLVKTIADQRVDVKQPFQYIGNKYYYIEKSEELNWYAASFKCRELGGHLVNIESSEELDLLKDHLPNSRFWISVNDLASEGNYFSIATGNKMPYLRWANGEPDNSGNEDCIEISGFASYKMNDVRCDYNLKFICEANLTYR